jgi:hypothetical protein
MGLGRSLLRADDRDDDDEDDEDDDDGDEDEEEYESEGGDPRRAFEDIVARYEREADAAGAAERAARRKAAAAGGAYFATRRRAATSTASLAELDLAGAPRHAHANNSRAQSPAPAISSLRRFWAPSRCA